jgi:hypothetical protein
MGVILLSTGINLNDYLDCPKHVGREAFLIMTVSSSTSNSVHDYIQQHSREVQKYKSKLARSKGYLMRR